MKTRDAYYDNAKFFLIFLVVFGHFIQSYIFEEKWIYTLYTTIYTFHMPAFILISGFFAKGFHQKGYLGKLTKKLIIPYLIFQGIYTIYYYFILGDSGIELDPFNPQWSLWYLISLFFWNVMLFSFAKWRAGISLFLAVALGVLVGYFDEINSYLSLSRTFVFFPFFLLGYYFKKEYFDKFRSMKLSIVSILVLVCIFVGYYLMPDFDYKWLFGSKPYAELVSSQMMGGLIRLGIYAITFLAIFSFLSLVPNNRYFFTKWGMSSIYVYLLHGFFIKYFRNSELVGTLNHNEEIMILSLITILLIAFLSSKLIRSMAQPLIELKSTLFRKYVINMSPNSDR